MDVQLTDREREILQACLDHDGNIQKASDSLCITKGTTRVHLNRDIYKKLMVNSLVGALRVALAKDYISLETSLKNYPPLLLDDAG